MKRITFGLALFVGFLPLNSYRSVSAQGRLEVATFLRAPFVGYHVDEFSFVSAKPIASMTAQIAITPMNQVPAGGMMTVFPTALSAVDAERDSHFLFAISSATILEQHEDSTQIRTSVEFHANHPTSFRLGRAVVPEQHSPYYARVFGFHTDGEGFGDTIVFVPEPSTWVIAACGAIGLIGLRRLP